MTAIVRPRPESWRSLLARLGDEKRGVALIEFALSLPIFLLMSMTGAEMANYITTKMRVSQIALQLADNASRMGEGDLLSAKTISETDINDLLMGAELQAGELNLYKRGRVIISNIEPSGNKYTITWQRCRGDAAHASQYGDVGDKNKNGFGPTDQLVNASDIAPTMFVEVYYVYRPIISASLLPSSLIAMDETASMSVRDRRDLSQIYNSENTTKSTC